MSERPVAGTKSERTRATVRAAAAECFAASGFQSTTTAEIARRAGVSEGTVFLHYSSKLGLLTAVTREFYRLLQEQGEEAIAGDGTPTDRLRRLVADWCAMMAQKWDLVQAYIHAAQAFPGTELAHVVIESNRRYTRLYTGVIEEMKAAGDLDAAFPPSLARDMIFGTLEHSARGQRYAGRPVNTSDVGRQIVDLLVGGGPSVAEKRLARLETKLDLLLAGREEEAARPTGSQTAGDTVRR
ncbi:TetR/AcrR family transcriptional regulator [Gordonia hydrophobica]|uniref:TetR/AcrR family transcriptional regulator n=1 Tax=Gordonia hydrophobica TaxID=40516 RepID=A0ABZ2TVT8_9ACTN|nr:TetR/AcrR family transcriptional regulator [Gordonia hydrophobica]MBM7365948.1 AcrR family transcriptional regulator [Gordonia hydrophobica]